MSCFHSCIFSKFVYNFYINSLSNISDITVMILVPEVPCCRYKIERVGTIHRDREVNRICRDSISQSQRTPIKHHNSGTSLIDHSGTMSVALLSTERVSWAITLLMHQMASNICFFFLYFFLRLIFLFVLSNAHSLSYLPTDDSIPSQSSFDRRTQFYFISGKKVARIITCAQYAEYYGI